MARLLIQFQGTEGWPYVFEASTNLVHWEVLDTNWAPADAITLLETNLALFPHRYYRTRLVP